MPRSEVAHLLRRTGWHADAGLCGEPRLGSTHTQTRGAPSPACSPSCSRSTDSRHAEWAPIWRVWNQFRGWADNRGRAGRFRHRTKPGSGLVAPLPHPGSAARAPDCIEGTRQVAADEQGVLPSRGRVARGPGHCRASADAGVRAPRCSHRPRTGPVPGVPLPDRADLRPWPGGDLLAVTAHREASASVGTAADSRRRWPAGHDDPCRHSRAVPVSLCQSAGTSRATHVERG
jgi:hypothetical protein